jgi:[acyl-carrier-protein] S-malonyltransferase
MANLAFVFPGQGSQYVGMGKALFDRYEAAKRVFLEADEVLGISLGRLCFEGPEAELKRTENTQPAILTVSIAALRSLQSACSISPCCAAGHSLGEYSALVSVGALSFPHALTLVRERGRLMQEAVPEGQGLMAAILGLDGGQLEAICREAAEGEVVAVANLNGGGQIVIAGGRAAVLRAGLKARDRGAKKVVELPVSAAFHCALMLPAAKGMEKALQSVPVGPFSVGVITNSEARVNLDPGRVKSLLVEQIIKPVRWEESVLAMEASGVETVVEIGPGRVLCGLIKRISPRLKLANVETADDVARVAHA